MRKHTEILNTYADEKILKELGAEVREELDALTPEELRKTVVNSLESMSDAAEQLGQNPKYQEVKRDLDYVTQGKKAVDKYQKAKITYARKRLREMGKLGNSEFYELEAALDAAKRVIIERRIKAAQDKDFVPVCSECNGKLGLTKDGERECYRCVTMHEQAKTRAEEASKTREQLREEAEAKAVAEIRAEQAQPEQAGAK